MRDAYQRGEIIPCWKGFVRYDITRDYTIVAPLGFNLIYSFLYTFRLWVAMAFYSPQSRIIQQIELRTNQRGLND
jgi:hypothetical protein